MKNRIFAMLLMLCCLAIVAGGCTKKEMVKEDESLAQNEGLTDQTTSSTPAPTPVAQESVVKDDSLMESTVAVEPFETIYFDLDSYVLRQDARDALDKNAQWMLKKSAGTVRLEGNCDERGSDEYNLALGEKRAKAAQSYLVTLGVPADRLVTISYGKEKPVDPGHNDAAWAKNRRVDFVIVK
jgi:peptidoglycan-associated lipoprotein